MTARDKSREKAAGACDNCGELFTVWVHDDGTVRPISPHNACSCDDPELRAVDETSL
ncbi:hypothetical protein [Natrarchaeobius chitinivorans]|uniref:hypothetical protein n=1 Tax=Natrarchaeobius chitinivorans TaxID=1679083 RepID=UPI00140458DE|nr:hypothetical protein [Natrarchaeobius chitinivorans]